MSEREPFEAALRDAINSGDWGCGCCSVDVEPEKAAAAMVMDVLTEYGWGDVASLRDEIEVWKGLYQQAVGGGR